MGFFGFSSVFSVVFFLAFTFILIMFIVQCIKGLTQWNKNNNSPLLSVNARLVAKRSRVSRHVHDNHHHSTTSYFLTFEFENKSRLELSVSGTAFGLYAEGDTGLLSFQGTRFKGFERDLA